MKLDGVDVKPYDTLVYRPTQGSEVCGEVRHVEEGEGLDVRVNGITRGVSIHALRVAEAEGRLRIEPAAGRVGEGEVDG
jgi:DNA-directed RNA polymerase subunit E'/Rpb7